MCAYCVAAVPEAVVHVGPHKTGSTTIQAALLVNSRLISLLQREHPPYASTDKIPGVNIRSKNHANLAAALRLPNMTASPAWIWFAAYARQTFAAGKGLIISSEDLSAVHYFNRTNLAAFMKMLTEEVGFRVRVVVVHRRLYEKLPSVHSELYLAAYRAIIDPTKYLGIVDWLARADAAVRSRFHQTVELRDLFAQLGAADVEVLDLHRIPESSSLTTEFVCKHMRAPETCKLLNNSKLRPAIRNVRPRNVAPLFDIIYAAALDRGVTRIDPVGALRTLKALDVLNRPKLAIPLRCPDQAALDEIWRASKEEERAILRRQLTASEATALRKHYAMKRPGLCSADVKAVLASPAWAAPIRRALQLPRVGSGHARHGHTAAIQSSGAKQRERDV
jgi:hypothetical protein